ncbi:arginine N-succinyltransferase [Haliangium ochraceum]|uniref:Arginine N-succinyltransferase n=1 Tax=Haliangium ochraceum (strain DSM 14365 / JCM 11303 / SMP-2) TaxID=502025 RepID=D0LSV6_HALO1|nr:arginine N-succinyltransferase [Haliangium ochraceum]ACY17328.1 Arginine N-succinyltransferase [Haliangium ochraceum DSM 14365]
MFRIRESTAEDLDQIFSIAKHLDTVNLPADRGELEKLLALSESAFAGVSEPAEREYLFVLEDLEAKRLIGTSIIHAQHGTRRSPHVYFEVLDDQRYSETLDSFFKHQGLRLGYDYDGPTEIGGLILLPDYRGHGERLGQFLSYVRFLFIAMHREVFREEIHSELLPPLEPDGTSKLWEHLGRRFTGLGYQEADMLSKYNKEFIRALFPHSIIYTSLFPQDVKALIGEVGQPSRGVEKILRRIGFAYARHIDPFDGGPHFRCKTDEVSLIKNAVRVEVHTVEGADTSRPVAMLAVEREQPRFAAACARVIPLDDGNALGITRAVQDTLGVSAGDSVWATYP